MWKSKLRNITGDCKKGKKIRQLAKLLFSVTLVKIDMIYNKLCSHFVGQGNTKKIMMKGVYVCIYIFVWLPHKMIVENMKVCVWKA